MSNIYVISDDKTLRNTASSKNYVGENNSEAILILVPCKYNGTEVKNCKVVINFDEKNIHRELKPCVDLYKDAYLVYKYPVGSELTKKAGDFPFYITIKSVDFNMQTSNSRFTVVQRK